jgi:hypothetical protein
MLVELKLVDSWFVGVVRGVTVGVRLRGEVKVRLGGVRTGFKLLLVVVPVAVAVVMVVVMVFESVEQPGR